MAGDENLPERVGDANGSCEKSDLKEHTQDSASNPHPGTNYKTCLVAENGVCDRDAGDLRQQHPLKVTNPIQASVVGSNGYILSKSVALQQPVRTSNSPLSGHAAKTLPGTANRAKAAASAHVSPSPSPTPPQAGDQLRGESPRLTDSPVSDSKIHRARKTLPKTGCNSVSLLWRSWVVFGVPVIPGSRDLQVCMNMPGHKERFSRTQRNAFKQVLVPHGN